MVGENTLAASDRERIARFHAAGQGHVFRFLDELDSADAARLLADASAFDLDHVLRLTARAPGPQPSESPRLAEIPRRGVTASDPGSATPRTIEPPGDEFQRHGESGDDLRRRDEARDRGLSEIEAGRVAALVVAGGQGTRLGATVPKAMWPVGPVSGKSLLQWHAEKVLHWSRRTGRPVPFVVLVSDATEAATAEFLRANRWFGLDPAHVHLPRQGSLPAVGDDGRILLATKSRIALAPNGHGGVFAALRDSGVLDRLAEGGVQTIAYCQVDNPLLRTIDPVFLGFHALHRSQFSSKSVAKRSPSEKVGVFARCDGRACVVEYSEMTPAQCRATDADGGLLLGQGNIAAHCIDLDFARSAAARGLPFHRARKKVPHVGADGCRVEPTEPNATKFESFVFDALPWAERTLVLETRRADEFSPIKNAEGEDSPESAQRDLRALFCGWHERAGLPVPSGPIEVDPLEAPDEHAFREKRGLPWR